MPMEAAAFFLLLLHGMKFFCLPSFLQALTLIVITASSPGLLQAFNPENQARDTFEKQVKPFIRQHCVECHSGLNAKASFQIDRLGLDFHDPANANAWQEVMDEINLGEMPPEEKPRPEADQVFEVAEWIAGELRRAERESKMAGGQVLMRRLNREEYANTVVDLLALDENQVEVVKEMLPADGLAEGFDRIGAALFFDQTQMERYLLAGKMVADLAIREEPPEAGLLTWEAAPNAKKPETMGLAFIEPGVRLPVGPQIMEIRDDGVLVWSDAGRVPSQRFAKKGFVHMPDGKMPNAEDIVTADGYYKIRLFAGGFPGKRGEPIKLRVLYGRNLPIETEATVEVSGTLEEPQPVELTMFLRKPGTGQRARFELSWNGLEDVRIRHPAPQAFAKKFGATTRALSRARTAGSADRAELEAQYEKELAEFEQLKDPIFMDNPERPVAEVPKVFLSKIEIEGPTVAEWPPQSHERLGLRKGDRENEQTVRRIFKGFLPFAYRRQVADAEVELMVTQTMRAMNDSNIKLSYHDALRLGLQTVLCSPAFLFIHEPRVEERARPLTDWELANRLSYFLWNSMPDMQLFQLAAAGQLKDPAVLRGQVSRMLLDPKSARFVRSFAGQWLDVRRYGSIEPAREYSDYDSALLEASKIEPLAFFDYLMRENLPITNLIDSEFLVINERLARHYEIPGVKGENFQVVSLSPEIPRGGVLGMAGLMTLLSDGTRTMPVSRAAWVREKMFHDPPPPPPPGAGEVQPNTGGRQLTVRERLERHREDPTCASCHATLDGYGLALENYDAIGKWRTHANGENFREGSAPKIDASGELKSGRKFADLEGYKQALLEEKETFAEAFATQMLTYAIGRPVGAIDRNAVTSIVQQLRAEDYRIQTLVQAIVASDLFQTK